MDVWDETLRHRRQVEIEDQKYVLAMVVIARARRLLWRYYEWLANNQSIVGDYIGSKIAEGFLNVEMNLEGLHRGQMNSPPIKIDLYAYMLGGSRRHEWSGEDPHAVAVECLESIRAMIDKDKAEYLEVCDE